jgi:hypothetical protein
MEWRHADDPCDHCDDMMDCFRSDYPEDGYVYYSWLCRKCEFYDDKHDYYEENNDGK